jgi:glutathione S-transferase
MTLYVKAGPDGTSLGDCPFAQFVRMVLEVKGLEYELKPCVQDTKPGWLIEFYDGKMPALRHRKECYVESDTIAAYIDFFFPKPELTPNNDILANAATAATDGLFPAIAQYIKHIPDGDEIDAQKKENLLSVLNKLNDHLSLPSRTGPYLVGDGNAIRTNDCKLAPMLYHMSVAIPAYKGEAFESLLVDFPFISTYADHMFNVDPSFRSTVYPPEVILWGWGNARNS